jgi:PAS domain S-box-containing protein
MNQERFRQLRDRALMLLETRGTGADGGAALVLHEMEVLHAELEVQQEELRDSQRRAEELAAHYRQLFFESPLALVLLGADGRARELNQQAVALLGVHEGTEFGEAVAWLDRPRWDRAAQELSSTPTALELSMRRRGGEQRRCVATLSRQGEGLLVSLSDLSELHETQAQRRIADERLARVLSDSRDGVLFSEEATGLIKQVNEALAVSLLSTPAELVGRSLASLFPEAVRARQELSLQHASAQEVSAVLSLQLVRSDGTLLPVEATVGRLKEGPQVLLTLLVHDVSDRLRLEAERETLAQERYQAQKLDALGQLAAGVAHDMNNVLTVILSCASIEADAPRAELEESLSEIREAALGARDVTSRLGVLSRKQPLHERRFDVLQMLLKRTLPPAIEVLVDVPAQAAFVTADDGEWHTAFLNLALNARDAMPRGGTLRFSARAEEAALVVEVRDTGEGMTPGVLARAFEPFFTTKVLGKGTGLGLSQVQAIARAHQVELGCSSSPGQGTTFTFRFPGVRLESPPVAADSARPALLRGRVLLVDDDELTRRATRRLLKQLGVEPVDVASGQAALAHLEAGEPFDLLLSDLLMPGMDGLTLAQAAHQRWPGLPVVVITGTVDEARRTQLLQAGVTAVLGKPFQFEELRAQLVRVLPKTN